MAGPAAGPPGPAGSVPHSLSRRPSTRAGPTAVRTFLPASAWQLASTSQTLRARAGGPGLHRRDRVRPSGLGLLSFAGPEHMS